MQFERHQKRLYPGFKHDGMNSKSPCYDYCIRNRVEKDQQQIDTSSVYTGFNTSYVPEFQNKHKVPAIVTVIDDNQSMYQLPNRTSKEEGRYIRVAVIEKYDGMFYYIFCGK